MENYYELLEVDVKASKEVIDKAFKVLAKRYHPDTQTEDKKQWAEEMFKKINEAYEVLSDEEARKKYDVELDYDKNSGLQALCAKNEHLQKLVEQLQNELEQVKRENTSTINNFASYYNKKINDYQNHYNNINQDATHVNTTPQQTVYYETRVPYTRNRLKDFIAFIITIICIIGVGFLLWKIPFTHAFLVKIYEENAPIKVIVDFFLGLFKR